MLAVMCASLDTALQDPAAKLASVKAAQKFFSEDKDRSFEAKVCVSQYLPALSLYVLMQVIPDDG